MLVHRVFFSSICLLAGACAHSRGPADSQAQNQTDADMVATQIKGVAHHIDLREWTDLRNLYADKVETDYTSLFGGEIQRQPADALIKTWKNLLTPMVTQHQLGPIDVSIQGDVATARCHVRGYHYSENAPSGPLWIVAGHYVFRLKRAADSWEITHMKLETFYQTGNRKLLQEATQNVEG